MYGPYDAAAATSYSQPDWYIGFLEGSLRLFPPWETRVGGYVINNIFYSGVVLPTLIFAPLFAVPWIERFCTGDSSEHHLLDRPRDAANRTAIGVGSITAVTVLFLGGAQDVIANTLEMPIATVTRVLQGLFLIAPPIAFWTHTPVVPRAAATARARPRRTRDRDRAHRRRRLPHRVERTSDTKRPITNRSGAMIAVDAPLTEQAETIDRVWNLFLGLGLVVLVLVAGLMLWVIVRYRKRPTTGHTTCPRRSTTTSRWRSRTS